MHREKSICCMAQFLIFLKDNRRSLCFIALLCQSTTELLLHFQLTYSYIMMAFRVGVLHHISAERSRKVASLHVTQNLRTSSRENLPLTVREIGFVYISVEFKLE